MKSKLPVLIFGLLSFLVVTQNTNAKTLTLLALPDSTCCAPDSLEFVSENYPEFCVSWHVSTDSTCKAPIGFEVQWKLQFGFLWHTKTISYSSGSTILFCDTIAGCGTHQWRVRTICYDSSYSDWVDGKKFNVTGCLPEDRIASSGLTLSPNPASTTITLSANLESPGPLQITIVDISGKPVYTKNINTGKLAYFRENISVTGWRKGMYFINIKSNGVFIKPGKFIKE
ncbi:MAG: T9SS type A sorting domain-containing protein [Calditrichae bacterium]|nr:T9SS type A sorting domain-containing protein [Calditrichia bacterium]